jgi:hypothetical protein
MLQRGRYVLTSLSQEEVHCVLYRHITIQSDDTLRMLARALRKNDVAYGTSSVQIRSIEFRDMNLASFHAPGEDGEEVHCDTPSLTIDLMTILMGAVNLESLSAQGYYALAGLTVASRVCSAALQHLEIEVHSGTIAMPSLGFITHFPNLHELKVSIKSYTLQFPPDASPWTLNRLRIFNIQSRSNDPPSTLTQFLCRCHLPSITVFNIQINVSRSGEEASKYLSIFFKSLSHLKEANLRIVGMVYKNILPHLAVPCLEFAPLDTTAVTSLSPTTHTLRINSSTVAKQLTELAGMLDVLHAEDGGLVKTIHIYGDGDDAFSWVSGVKSIQLGTALPSISTIMPCLLYHAARLFKKGIVIRDSHGKTAMDYFTDT